MDEFQPSGLRLSDTERDEALRVLGEHMSTGRLDLAEYGERSARVTAAKTRGDLGELFVDLPQPHPVIGGATAGQPTPASTPQQPEPKPAAGARTPAIQRFSAALMPIAGIAGLVLFFATGAWWWFLLPAVIACAGGALFGDDFKHHTCGGGRSQELRLRRRELRMQRRSRW